MKMQQFRKRLMMLGIERNLENREANPPPERNSAVAELRRATCLMTRSEAALSKRSKAARARRGPST